MRKLLNALVRSSPRQCTFKTLQKPQRRAKQREEEDRDMSERRQAGRPAPPRAVRLRFTYEGDEVSLVSRQPVEMTAPPTDKLSGYEDEQGFWIEVRSGQDQTLHRWVMEDPLRRDVEVFSPDPEQSVSRAPVEKVSGSFSVVVPDLDEADYVALLSSGAPSATARDVSPEAAARAPAGPATEFARFSLRPEHEGGEA
jgi:hypothetical protein